MAKDTLLRQWATLELIPREPAKHSTSTITTRLKDLGHDVSVRTVQRDLVQLSAYFAFSSEEEGRSYLWFWPKLSKGLQLPLPDGPTSLALILAEEHLKPLLPPATLELLSPALAGAEHALTQKNPELAEWKDKVRVVSSGPALSPASVDSKIQRTVYNALLNDLQIEIEYRARYRDDISRYTISPLGLISRDGLIYLLVVGPYEPFQLALHRITSALMLGTAATPPDGFTLEGYVNNNSSSEPEPAKIRLKIRMKGFAAKLLLERPLSSDQHIEADPNEDDWMIITATVRETNDLKWWLQSYGRWVEVVEPPALRKQFKKIVRAMKRLYK